MTDYVTQLKKDIQKAFCTQTINATSLPNKWMIMLHSWKTSLESVGGVWGKILEGVKFSTTLVFVQEWIIELLFVSFRRGQGTERHSNEGVIEFACVIASFLETFFHSRIFLGEIISKRWRNWEIAMPASFIFSKYCYRK